MLVSLAINIIAVIVIAVVGFYAVTLAIALFVYVVQSIGDGFRKMFNLKRRY